MVGLAPEKYVRELNAAMGDLRNKINHVPYLKEYALRVFEAIPEVRVKPYHPRPDINLWLGRLLFSSGSNTEFLEVCIEQTGSIGLWLSDWIRKQMMEMSSEALSRTRKNIRLFKAVMKQLKAYKLSTGGVRGIVAELLILQGGGEFMTLMDELYSHTILDDNGELFKIRPQAEVARTWLLENPSPDRAAPHLFHNLLMHLDHGEPPQPLETNGWNWRVLTTLAWSVHWMRKDNINDLVSDIERRVDSNPLEKKSHSRNV